MVYDLKTIRETWRKEDLKSAHGDMWRYAPVLPSSVEEAVTLVEGWTPLVRARGLERELGAQEIWLKDESRNPAGSMEARRFSAITSSAKGLGVRKLSMASDGSAASALAAYAAAAELEARIYMPRHAPQSVFIECKALGANVRLVDGGMDDCARLAGETREDSMEVEALDAFGREGAKTLVYEVAEQFGWQVPDAIVHSGDERDAMAFEKAWKELEELNWIGAGRPRTVAAQPGSVQNEEALDQALLMARCDGIFPTLETGACVAAARGMLRDGKAKPENRIVIVNAGAGLKQIEKYATRYSRQGASEQDKLGGLITPR
ncbi:MAG: pyridoxal-phosphate dependent enzyme [Acidobacteriaceae bacterium]|nr:pyridoxal-phosphate dependent enzyme [Acidobacteriaceae bacterium]